MHASITTADLTGAMSPLHKSTPRSRGSAQLLVISVEAGQTTPASLVTTCHIFGVGASLKLPHPPTLIDGRRLVRCQRLLRSTTLGFDEVRCFDVR
ncbi:hypothetical protein CBOM_08028 [Ceraceosorus bombacis]|uniref:Uncharacterized protein n=1 Tax=Ceraceosorus bombacis TaxID=401625 RepID=A0A0P1BRH8_9BASI|nr:hypothetical protein CBOM_08028 [Ceraceosorus bombacis]